MLAYYLKEKIMRPRSFWDYILFGRPRTRNSSSSRNGGTSLDSSFSWSSGSSGGGGASGSWQNKFEYYDKQIYNRTIKFSKCLDSLAGIRFIPFSFVTDKSESYRFKKYFSREDLQRIESTVSNSETRHQGEIKIILESSLPVSRV